MMRDAKSLQQRLQPAPVPREPQRKTTANETPLRVLPSSRFDWDKELCGSMSA
jgi:hypothetical protein